MSLKNVLKSVVSRFNEGEELSIKRCQYTTGVRQASQGQFFENLYLSKTKEFLFIGQPVDNVKKASYLFVKELVRLNIDSPVVDLTKDGVSLIYQYINDHRKPVVVFEFDDYRQLPRLDELKELARKDKIMLVVVCLSEPLPHEYGYFIDFSCIVTFKLTTSMISMSLTNSAASSFLEKDVSIYRVKCVGKDGCDYLLSDIYRWSFEKV